MARATTSLSLGKHYESFIVELVDSGRYDSASAVVEEGLRLLEVHQRQLDWLREQIAIADEQIQNGQVHEDSDAFWDELDREVDEMIKRGDRPSPHVCP